MGRSFVVWLSFSVLVACAAGPPQCTLSDDCSAGRTCINGECVGPPCTSITDCTSLEVCAPDGVCRRADAGSTGMDAAFDAGDRVDSSPDSSRMDAGIDGGLDGGFDGGLDAGCECGGSSTIVLNCSVCGSETSICDGCFYVPQGCFDNDSRCAGNAPFCRNDYCWGWHLESGVGTADTQCIDFDIDYLPGLPQGFVDVQVYGRPGARYLKDNRKISCAGASYIVAEDGTFDSAGRDVENAFMYGPVACDNTSMGRFTSRVRIIDTLGRPAFTLPNIMTSSLFHSGCPSDRDSCDAAATYCVVPM